MAKSVNKAILLGNAGKDPEIRAMPSGVKVATLTVATTDRSKDKSGEWREQTEWHTVVAYARMAEVMELYVKKGSKLYIEGKIETRSWEDARTGEKKYQTQIKIEDLVLCDGAQGARTQGSEVKNPGSGSSRPAEQTRAARAPEENGGWDDFH